jgi:hypothetical protein
MTDLERTEQPAAVPAPVLCWVAPLVCAVTRWHRPQARKRRGRLRRGKQWSKAS